MGHTQRMTNATTGGPLFVDVEDGKIVRMFPIDLDEEDKGDWVIEARGRKFSPPRRTTLSPHAQAQRSMVYSPNRILYPMKRVDWDPEGERNIQNRGVSGYERISWDEALDLVTTELVREKRENGPGSILTTCSSHHLWGNLGYRHSAYYRFLNLMGMVHTAHNPDSWEGWHWGAMPMWGNSHRLGIPEQYDLLEDALKHTEMIVFWSSDPESTGGGIYSAFESTSRRYWMKELGIKMVFVDPYYNPTAELFSDKWFAPRLGTDVAFGLGIAHVWLAEDLYDKEYVAARTHGFDEWKDYVLGQDGQRAEDAGVGRDRDRRPRPPDPRPGPRVGHEEDHARRRRPGRLGRCLPLRHRQRVGAHHGRPGRHAGLRQAGRQHLGHLAGGAVGLRLRLSRLRRGRHVRRP